MAYRRARGDMIEVQGVPKKERHFKYINNIANN